MSSSPPILITGASGFVGLRLARRLLAVGHPVHGAGLATAAVSDGGPDPFPDLPGRDWTFHELDLSRPGAAAGLIANLRPAAIYHLAGQSSAARSFTDPAGTFADNLGACLQLLEGVRALPPDARPRLVTAGSAEEYGPPPDASPLREDAPLRPGSPYGVSKAAQTLLCQQYHRAFDLPVIATRPFAHTGAGQAPAFAFPSFARQIRAIERGEREPVLRVGNLEARRDYLHVEDVIDAYLALMATGRPGEVYNICSGKAYAIGEGLDMLLAASDAGIRVERDPDRYRPLDIPCLLGDPGKLAAATDWRPRRSLRDALQELLDWTREIVT